MNFLRKLIRRQVTKTGRQIADETTAHNLERRLNLAALIFLNVSNSIGSGIYVLTGMASNLYAGQFVSVSYFIAGIACLLSAFCFAEFASRIKTSAGSSYTFIYHSLGEFCAFIIGWLLFIGSLTSIAATSITWSDYLDTILDHAIKNFTTQTLHAYWELPSPFSTFLDIPAILVTVTFFLVSLRGIQLTALFNNMLAVLNISLLLLITIGGFVYGNLDNLINTKYSNGFNGIIKGSSIVIYAYIGFESSTFAIEEALNPASSVPLSMIISIFLIMLTYCGSSLSLNLMQPFDKIDLHSSFPSAFKNVKLMYFVVSIGPIMSLIGSLVSSIFSTARIAYTMSKDGLLFKCLSSVNVSSKIPDMATIWSMIICLLLILLFDVENLIGFTDISGFLIYSAVAMGLLVMRYNHDTESIVNQTMIESSPDSFELSEDRVNLLDSVSESELATQTIFKKSSTAILIIISIFLSN
ncbi:cationic amino acid transporter 4, partial [Brachionus plicatilis]